VDPTSHSVSPSHGKHGHEGLLDIAMCAVSRCCLEGRDASVISKGLAYLVVKF
jgi:hypothetical protein